MPVYKDKERNTYYCRFYYTDWQGQKRQKCKRGFKLQREAKEWERLFLEQFAKNPDITFESLYEKYKDKNFVIIGFPANNFMGQEPGSNEEIAKFCSLNYDVTFPMMSKISVKGKDMAPLYQWLTEKKLNGKEDAPVQWNFQKFMIDENGNWIGFVAPKESPFSEKILTWIEKK